MGHSARFNNKTDFVSNGVCRQYLQIAAAACFAAALGTIGAYADTTAPKAAIAGFSYEDTSGEVHDQSAAHAGYVERFRDLLTDRLGASYRIVPLECAQSCPPVGADAQKVFGFARQSGADYLVSGGFHKESTLVQWAKVTLFDVRTGQPVYDRLYTFRGDNEEAWRRAGEFIAREFINFKKSQQ